MYRYYPFPFPLCDIYKFILELSLSLRVVDRVLNPFDWREADF